MKSKFRSIYFLILGAFATQLSAQTNLTSEPNFRYPLDIPATLSANFGELRANHFHTGIDLKTQAVINKPVYSVEDGYVSRISVSPWGYGLALYISHPSGHTSVYGHLEGYAPKINVYLREKQYEMEKYSIDLTLEEGFLPIKKGELIAKSGNTGSSMGPHVHFEIRQTQPELVLDPLPFYKVRIADTQKPQIRGIGTYPIEGKGVINGSSYPSRYRVTANKDGSAAALKNTITAWGKIGMGIYAIDRMSGVNNIFGVKIVELWCNGEKIFTSNISSISFDQTRMINSMTDFDYWKNEKVFYMKSFIEPGNKLPIYESVNNGYIDINEEKTYDLKYVLADLYGNKTTYSLSIVGKKQEIPTANINSQLMKWAEDNYQITSDFSLTIPQGNLYTDIRFNLLKEENSAYFSEKYTINDSYVPLHSNATISIKIKNDTLTNKKQYGIVSLNGNGKEQWLGGTYKDGVMDINIRELGNTYTIYYDSELPVINPITPEKWAANKKIRIKATDNFSGVKTYRGTIDGKYVLFQYDSKSPTYTYSFDNEKLERSKNHKLQFTVADDCGNTSNYEYEFYY